MSLSFPPMRIAFQTRRSADVNEHASFLSDWRQEYDQLSSGAFTGLVRELWLDSPPLQVFHEFTGQQTSQCCQPWPGSVWFGIPDGSACGSLHFSGRLQGDDRLRVLMMARAEDGFTLRTPPGFGIYGIVVGEAWLATCFEALGCPLDERAGVRVTPLTVPDHAELCRVIECLLALAGSGAAAADDTVSSTGAPPSRDLHTLCTLTGQLLQQLAAGLGSGRSAGMGSASRRQLSVVLQARALAIDPLNSLLSVEDLGQRLGLTPRTLHNHFLKTVGGSPAEFLRAVRLNACRRRLLDAVTDRLTVQDVAAQWGFFHMGRFSQAYRDLFGELPSQTLRSSRVLADSVSADATTAAAGGFPSVNPAAARRPAGP